MGLYLLGTSDGSCAGYVNQDGVQYVPAESN
jgi:hypothetical protein